MCYCVFVLLVFFFFKQKTAYEVRISDWSSDVCSSDLLVVEFGARLGVAVGEVDGGGDDAAHLGLDIAAVGVVGVAGKAHAPELRLRAPCENGDAVAAILAVPDRAVTGRLAIGRGGSLVGAPPLMEPGVVRLMFR